MLMLYTYSKIGHKFSKKKQEDNAKRACIVSCVRKRLGGNGDPFAMLRDVPLRSVDFRDGGIAGPTAVSGLHRWCEWLRQSVQGEFGGGRDDA